MRSFLFRCSLFSGIVALCCTAFLGYVYLSTQTVPEFYREALAAAPEVQKQAADELEQTALQLHNQIVEAEQWEATFTDEQINGWLATGLSRKFPDALPPTVQDPRFSIHDDRVVLVCRFEGEQFRGIVQLECEVFLADEDNTLGLKVCRLQSGLVPLPIHQWIDRVTLAAAQAGFPLQWSQMDGAPVALLEVDLSVIDEDREHRLERIEVVDGQLTIAGTSGIEDPLQVAEHEQSDQDQSSHQ